jgi:hypothetical protein
MTANAFCKPNRPVPTSAFGKHQVGTGRPMWKFKKLRGPHDPFPSRHDFITVRWVVSVDDFARLDAQSGCLIRIHTGIHATSFGKRADLTD